MARLLIHPLPNTYTYSKRLTESMLHDYVSKVPIIVARPSIVGPCFKEPFPGWSDSINGPMGFYVAGGRGVMRTTTMNLDSKANMIPADISINSIIILPWANSREQLLKEVGVYNISQNSFENVTWRELLHTCMRALAKYPLDIMLWYPNTDPATKSMFVYTIKCIFLHYLPAYVIDFILLLAGQKQFLVRAHDKLRQGEKMLRLFTQKEWLFKHDKILQLEQLMNPIDRQIFPVNTKEMQDVQSYTDDCMLSAKFHIFREDLKHRKRSKIIMNIMYALDKIVLVLRYYILGKFLLFIFNTLWSIFNRAEDMPSY